MVKTEHGPLYSPQYTKAMSFLELFREIMPDGFIERLLLKILLRL